MKAITVKQPWASLIWPTKVRGRVAITSSAKDSPEEWAAAIGILASLKIPMDVLAGARLTRGMLIGTVEIVDCVTSSKSPWFVGEYGFVLRNPIVNSIPIPIKGSLGFWDLPEDIAGRLQDAR